ncbi:MAG: hypothetical protein H0V70_12205 [Ktedonobacteraceae bacterium]|nr:hypothetical protein [Ktedonobacteraceae bacterium]
MHSFSKQEQLRHLLNEQHEYLQHTISLDNQCSLLALIRASNWHYFETQPVSMGDYKESSISGLQKALSLCLSTQNAQTRVSEATSL